MNINALTGMQFEDTCDKTLEDLTLKYSNEAGHNKYINFWQKYFPEAIGYIERENFRYSEKIKQDPTWATQSYKKCELTRVHEIVSSWNITKILLYVIEIRTRYKHYNSKYDEHLYEFCYTFLNNYYDKDTESILLEMRSHVFNETSTLYNRITNYIQRQADFKMLRNILNDTTFTSIERFQKSCWDLRNPSLRIA